MPTGFETATSDRKEIEAIARERKSPSIQKTIAGKTLENAREKVAIEEREGWLVDKENKKSIKIKKYKQADHTFEDEIWCTMAAMGFATLSKDRNFRIYVSDKTPSRQIDVFAKDDETALFIECTCCEELKTKDLSHLIEKIKSYRKEIFDAFNSHYGTTPKYKLKFIIATKNIEWRSVDLIKAREDNIGVLQDQEIEYYKRLAKHLKSAARYQLLGYIFAKQEISALDLTVPATKGKMGGITFYTFLINPTDLLKIAYISHKASKKIEDLDTYQRMAEPARLSAIADFIDNGGQFPTSIVVNFKTDRPLRFDKIENIGDAAFGKLYLPQKYASAWVVDGQHRLYGYAYSKRSLLGKDDKTTFSVFAYENLSQIEEAKMFVDINTKQVRVKTNLINEIFANLDLDSPIFQKKVGALCSQVVMRLNNAPGSPFCDRIVVSTKEKTKHRCLTLTTLIDEIQLNKLFGEQKKALFKPGPLYASYRDDIIETREKAMAVLWYVFDLFRTELNEHWERGDGPDGYLCTNNGIRALLKVFSVVCRYLEKTHNFQMDDLHVDDFKQYLPPLFDPIISFFKTATPDDIKQFRSRQAQRGVTLNSLELMALINRRYENFTPPELDKYLSTIDREGTKEAQGLVTDIQQTLFLLTITILKNTFGKDWEVNIPLKIRQECGKRWEEEGRVKDMIQYLDLLDYQSIASAHWPLFDKYFTISKEGGKEKKLSWIKELNTVRRIVMHPEKWPATKEQVQFVKKIYNHVLGKIKPYTESCECMANTEKYN